MGTFVEFYCTLLGFINYKLYTSIGLVYPPKFDVTSDERGAELAAFTLEGRNVTDSAIENGEETKAITNGHSQSGNSADVQATIDKIAQEEEQGDAMQLQDEVKDDVEVDGNIDRFEVSAPEADELPQPETSSDEAASLFSNFTFYISREAPRHPIEFLLRAFGCKRIGWDRVLGEGAFTHDETDSRITHQIVDRPAAVFGTPNGDQQAVKPGFIVAGRIYVQPQWVWDCVNEARLARTDLYAPGATLPPHLSPWMKPVKGQYDPRATLEEQQLPGEEEEDEDEELDDEEAQELLKNAEPDVSDEEEINGAADGMKVDMEGDDEEDEEAQDNSFGGFEEEDIPEDGDEEDEHEVELAAEAAGVSLSAKKSTKTAKDKRKQERTIQQKQADEEIERQKMMMSNKKRKLYEKMQHSNTLKDAEAEKLRGKRRKLEKKQK